MEKQKDNITGDAATVERCHVSEPAVEYEHQASPTNFFQHNLSCWPFQRNAAIGLFCGDIIDTHTHTAER